MKFESFQAGVWRQQTQYKSFSPVPVDHEWTWEDGRIHTLLERSAKALAELNAYSQIEPDIDLFIQMFLFKEACHSCHIEGAHLAIDEALMPEAQVAPEKRHDWQMVHDYVDAVGGAAEGLEAEPLSCRLLCQIHAKLVDGASGPHGPAGEFRVTQNWIGGSGLLDAVFPPPHPSEVPDLMEDLEAFWTNESVDVPHLIRIGISHYQFETVHPFGEANGRLGRLLIPLYLVDRGVMRKSSLFLSEFFDRNRAHYHDALMRVRIGNDIIHWIRFFLTGVAETSIRGNAVFQKVLALRRERNVSVSKLGRRAQIGRELIHLLYRTPYVTASDVAGKLGVSIPTANALIRDFVSEGILKQVAGARRNRGFAFSEYINLFMAGH